MDKVEAKEAIRKRKCVKKFLNKPVSMKIILEMLDCGRWAQTALGAQSWEFIIVKKVKAKARLAEAAGQEWISSAPVVIVVCTNMERIEFTLKRPPWDFAVMEVSAAVQNIQIAARSLGMGTCAAFMFDRDSVSGTLKTPKKVIPLAIVPLGYPKEFPENSRGSLQDFMHEEEFGQPVEGVPAKYNKKWRRSPLIHLFS